VISCVDIMGKQFLHLCLETYKSKKIKTYIRADPKLVQNTWSGFHRPLLRAGPNSWSGSHCPLLRAGPNTWSGFHCPLLRSGPNTWSGFHWPQPPKTDNNTLPSTSTLLLPPISRSPPHCQPGQPRTSSACDHTTPLPLN